MQIHKPAYQIPLEIYIYIYTRTLSLKHKRVLRDRCRCKHTDGTLCLQINWGTNEYLIASPDGCEKRTSQFRCTFEIYLASNYFYLQMYSSLFPEIRTRNSIWSAYVSVTSYFQIFRFLPHIFFASKLDRGLVVAVTAAVVVVHDRSPISKRKALNTKFRSREEINRPETRVGRNLHLRYQFTIKLRWIWPEPMANHM